MHADRPERKTPGTIVIGLAFLAVLAGRFTLDRMGLTVPILNDARVALLWLLLTVLVADRRWAGRSSAPATRWSSTGVVLVLIFLSYQGLSAAWAPEDARLSRALPDNVALACLVVVYWLLATQNRDRVVRVTMALFLAAGILYFVVAAAGYGHDPSGRWAALGGGSNVFVRVMVLAGVAAVYFFVTSGSKLVFLFPLPAFVTGAVLSGSRGGLLAAGCVIAAAAVPSLRRIRAGRLIALSVRAAVVAAGCWIFWGQQLSDAIQARLVTATLEQGYTSGRSTLFREAWEMFEQNPLVGVGLDGFYALTWLYTSEQYVHNLPLSVAAEGGVIGLFFLFGALSSLLAAHYSVRHPQRSLESRVALLCGLFVGVASLFSGFYYDSRLMWIFLVLAAVHVSHQDGDAPITVPLREPATSGRPS